MQDDDRLNETVEEPRAQDSGAGEEGAGEGEALPEDVETLRKELEEARARADEYWQRILRLQADLENLRKRASRDVENAHKYGLDKFITDLLPVKDSLELGVAAAEAESDTDKIREGVELTLKMFKDVLAKHGVSEVDPLGEKFDPALHQAMSMVENAEVEPNTVLTVMQKGYLLNDRLIRPAMVMVSKAPEG